MSKDLLRVLIVDDEILSRNGVAQDIAWEKYGFEVAACAEDGQQALDKIKEYQPDLILTDVCMPFMDGIELIEKIVDTDIDVIIMSAYDEFQYARAAVHLGVTAYILKPVTEEELAPFLLKIKERKKKHKENAIKIKMIQKIVREENYPHGSNGVMIEKAVRFIEENLSNPALSLQTVAEQAGMSWNYFCTVFKK